MNCCSALPSAHTPGGRGGAAERVGSRRIRREYRDTKKFRRRGNWRGAQGTAGRKLYAGVGREKEPRCLGRGEAGGPPCLSGLAVSPTQRRSPRFFRTVSTPHPACFAYHL
ncbi:uncharacterized protein LOC119700637 isoform X4 [Motacilla alba alba]|uniref:uncharacterized protein LOC119700637 isoform X4 n=1 Tax=Motacilla alba alba TaxID=1094192 RepID=UPI0018D51B8C|nr:uncharacterized protein LOC119700637 isoform X4 [Motacilla alba alba]